MQPNVEAYTKELAVLGVTPVEALRNGLADLGEKDQLFALNLLAAKAKYGKLTEKQEYWVEVLAARAAGVDDKPEQKTENVGDFTPVMDLFAKAKEHLKYPKIKLQAGEQEVQLAVAGPNAKKPGTVNVTDGKPFGQNVWFGRVTPDGVWEQNARVEEENLKPVRRLLQALAQDPAGTAKKYALLTGNCAFCGKKLTDPKSTAVGFGETCAKHFGLHTQWKKAVSVIQ